MAPISEALHSGAVAGSAHIEVILVDGTTGGPWRITKKNRIVRVIRCARSDFSSIKNLPELHRPAAYLLRGEDEAGAERIYIGRADVAVNRLAYQLAQTENDFCDEVILVTGDGDFPVGSAAYVEARLIKLAKEAKQVTVKQKDMALPAVGSEQSVAEDFLGDALDLFRVIGIRAFMQPKVEESFSSKGAASEFHLKGPQTDALGQPTPNGFLVRAGSRARPHPTPGCPPKAIAHRNELIEQKVLSIKNDALVVSSDHLFSSPSAAATVLLGAAANGRKQWKDASGTPLGEFESGV